MNPKANATGRKRDLASFVMDVEEQPARPVGVADNEKRQRAAILGRYRFDDTPIRKGTRHNDTDFTERLD
jgi:hypothetical protein